MIEGAHLFVTGANHGLGRAFVPQAHALAAGRAEVRIGALSNEVYAGFRDDPEGLARERAQRLPA